MRTGEEITCEIVERNEETGDIKIKNPIMLIQMPGADGQTTTQMVGWFQTSRGEIESDNEIKNRQFTLTKDMYFIEGIPMRYISDSYNNEFGAGIVVPPQNIVSAG
jgi:hypothetical protein